MPDLPVGTITFLLTDVEGSTRLWEQHPEAMRGVLARHDVLVEEAVQAHGGHPVRPRGEGDSRFAVFARASDAVLAAAAVQLALHREPWPAAVGMLRVRIALHTGEAELRDADYYGSAVNRCAREFRGLAAGGQVLLSQATCELVRDSMPPEITLLELGELALRDLSRAERLWQLVHPELPADFPPLRSPESPPPNNLPTQLTRFFGRESEIRELVGMLGPGSGRLEIGDWRLGQTDRESPISNLQSPSPRLVTLTGPGGVGKTRLSLQVGTELLDAYRDGVWFVELAPIADPGLVPQAVAVAVGVREDPRVPVLQTLREQLRERELLILLDNCEHVLKACAEVADALLRACPRLRLLASSREGLHIGGETLFPVPSLRLPERRRRCPPPEQLTQDEAVRLFLDRAQAARPGFAVTTENAPAVAQVCHRLDGIPLAIELAAARVRALSAEQIMARLDDQFRLLTGGSRTALPRQQTLRAAVDWSYDILSEAERLLLARLSVFAGGWTLEAAEAVCGDSAERSDGVVEYRSNESGVRNPTTSSLHHSITPLPDVLDLLASLVDKSLVVGEERGGETRYRMLETIRQYGAEKLQTAGETELLRQRHLDFMLQLAETAAARILTHEQVRWVETLEREHDNLRAALSFALNSQPSTLNRPEGTRLSTPPSAALRLAGGLWRFWEIRGFVHEGRTRLDEALESSAGELSGEAGAARGRALAGAALLACRQGDLERSRALAAESLVLRRALDDRSGIAELLTMLGLVAHYLGDYDESWARNEEALGIRRDLDELRGVAVNLNNLGSLALSRGDTRRAGELFQESLTAARQIGSVGDIARTASDAALTAFYEGDHVAVRRLCAESLELAHRLGDEWAIAKAQHVLARTAAAEGERDAAVAAQRDALSRWQEMGSRYEIADCLEELASLAAVASDKGARRAARLLSAAEALRERIGGPREPLDQPRFAAALAAAAAHLDDNTLHAELAAGRTLSEDQAVALALEEGV